jgi:hypothetical protein
VKEDAELALWDAVFENAAVLLPATVRVAQDDVLGESRAVWLAADDAEDEGVLEGVPVGCEEGGGERLVLLLKTREVDSSGESVAPALADAQSEAAADIEGSEDSVEVTVGGRDDVPAPEVVGGGLTELLTLPPPLPLVRADSPPLGVPEDDWEDAPEAVGNTDGEMEGVADAVVVLVPHAESVGYNEGVASALAISERVKALEGVSRPLPAGDAVGAPLPVAQPDAVVEGVAAPDGEAEREGARVALAANDVVGNEEGAEESVARAVDVAESVAMETVGALDTVAPPALDPVAAMLALEDATLERVAIEEALPAALVDAPAAVPVGGVLPEPLPDALSAPTVVVGNEADAAPLALAVEHCAALPLPPAVGVAAALNERSPVCEAHALTAPVALTAAVPALEPVASAPLGEPAVEALPLRLGGEVAECEAVFAGDGVALNVLTEDGVAGATESEGSGVREDDAAPLPVPAPALAEGASPEGENGEEGLGLAPEGLSFVVALPVPQMLPLADAHRDREAEALREARAEAESVGMEGKGVPLPLPAVPVATPLSLCVGEENAERVPPDDVVPDCEAAPPEAVGATDELVPADTLPLPDAVPLTALEGDTDEDPVARRVSVGEGETLALGAPEAEGGGERLPIGEGEPLLVAERDAREALPLALGGALPLREIKGDDDAGALPVPWVEGVLPSDGEDEGEPPAVALPEVKSLRVGDAVAAAVREGRGLGVPLALREGDALTLGDRQPLSVVVADVEGATEVAAEGEVSAVPDGLALGGAEDEADIVPPAGEGDSESENVAVRGGEGVGEEGGDSLLKAEGCVVIEAAGEGECVALPVGVAPTLSLRTAEAVAKLPVALSDGLRVPAAVRDG